MARSRYLPGARDGGLTAAAATIAVAACGATAAFAEPAAPDYRMALLPTMRACNFQQVEHVSGRTWARPRAEITTAGGVVVARVDITDGASNARYVVRLIPAPHPTLGCLAGDPSITTGAMVTDDNGTGSAMLQSQVASGVTGVWLAVDLPALHSQTPEEFYSSNYVAVL
jgi:hypothetical protein